MGRTAAFVLLFVLVLLFEGEGDMVLCGCVRVCEPLVFNRPRWAFGGM